MSSMTNRLHKVHLSLAGLHGCNATAKLVFVALLQLTMTPGNSLQSSPVGR